LSQGLINDLPLIDPRVLSVFATLKHELSEFMILYNIHIHGDDAPIVGPEFGVINPTWAGVIWLSIRMPLFCRMFVVTNDTSDGLCKFFGYDQSVFLLLCEGAIMCFLQQSQEWDMTERFGMPAYFKGDGMLNLGCTCKTWLRTVVSRAELFEDTLQCRESEVNPFKCGELLVYTSLKVMDQVAQNWPFVYRQVNASIQRT
jgi:hypothetical protein